jgi:8-oxo-dGTP pyrophosphatase MutT (NUDIX family)
LDNLTAFLRDSLAARRPVTRAEWDARPAAVLVPLYWHAGAWNVLFTLRTHMVETHKGQVSFPGGRVDPEDTSRVETALREAQEEIGLKREDVVVLGQLDELLTVTQYSITPIVGVFPWPYEFVLSTAELSEVFGVPLTWLADKANLEVKLRDPLGPGPKIPVYYLHYGSYTIWGATARILINLLDVLRPALGIA